MTPASSARLRCSAHRASVDGSRPAVASVSSSTEAGRCATPDTLSMRRSASRRESGASVHSPKVEAASSSAKNATPIMRPRWPTSSHSPSQDTQRNKPTTTSGGISPRQSPSQKAAAVARRTTWSRRFCTGVGCGLGVSVKAKAPLILSLRQGRIEGGGSPVYHASRGSPSSSRGRVVQPLSQPRRKLVESVDRWLRRGPRPPPRAIRQWVRRPP